VVIRVSCRSGSKAGVAVAIVECSSDSSSSGGGSG
jgi:hypothetical protein